MAAVSVHRHRAWFSDSLPVSYLDKIHARLLSWMMLTITNSWMLFLHMLRVYLQSNNLYLETNIDPWTREFQTPNKSFLAASSVSWCQNLQLYQYMNDPCIYTFCKRAVIKLSYVVVQYGWQSCALSETASQEVFRLHWYLLSPRMLSLLCAILGGIAHVSQHGFLSYFSAVYSSSLFCHKAIFSL